MPAIIATDTPNPLSIEDRRLADNGLNDENRLWLRYSPAGFHITDFVAFMRSPYKAPAKRHPAIKRHADDFNEDPKQALLAYNNSRESDRVCPVCYTWFRVGENPFENPDNFEQFIHRPYRQVDEGIDYMKQRTGRCGPVCDEVYLHCSKTRIDRRLRQICTEATLRRSSSWRRIKFWRKVPTPPEGIAVMVANNHEQEAGTRIVFIRKEMLQRSLV
ncbi:hypothetical protein BKA65DRAFT_507853 [Rhexocercosporidium sp. MPI-PUGE-AT-0058]|nr:hypothetical protein BKA65DRAFT_507853 [Rhexocercosporidium sp. MPI-PUGE-AT-0058]